MTDSLYDSDVQGVLDGAERAAGTPGGPWPSPADWRDQVVYFLMVDRFNNPDGPPAHAPYDDPDYCGLQGGKFAGVVEQLDYIRSLGAGAIWLSPVLKNLTWDPGTCYHGYGIHDFLRAQPKFARNPVNADNELRDLVDAAHKAGLYVIFDIVLNHTGDVFAYNGRDSAAFSSTPLPIEWRDGAGNANPAWSDIGAIPAPRPPDALLWPSELQQNRFLRRQGNPDPAGSDVVGDFDSLKQLMTSDPDLQAHLIRAYQYVIARYDPDGFRIDTIRYLCPDFARTFGNSMREFALSIGKKNFLTFGEVLDRNAEDDIARFIGRNTTASDDPNSPVGVDAALDYPLYNNLNPAVKSQGPPQSVVGMYTIRKHVEQFVLSSHGDATRFFVTFLDNHDMKYRLRWEDPGDPHRFDDQVTMGMACLYALPGIPCVYYGTEQGLHGYGSDPAVREALWGISPGFPRSTPFYQALQQISEVRNSEPALRYGRFYFRPVSSDSRAFAVPTSAGGILAWSRIISDQEVVAVANTSTTSSASVDVIVEATLSTPGGVFKVLYSNKAGPTPPAVVRTLTGVTVAETDGSTGYGPLNAIRVTLQPMEVQFLRTS